MALIMAVNACITVYVWYKSHCCQQWHIQTSLPKVISMISSPGTQWHIFQGTSCQGVSNGNYIENIPLYYLQIRKTAMGIWKVQLSVMRGPHCCPAIPSSLLVVLSSHFIIPVALPPPPSCHSHCFIIPIFLSPSSCPPCHHLIPILYSSSISLSLFSSTPTIHPMCSAHRLRNGCWVLVVVVEVVMGHYHLIHPVSKGTQCWGVGVGVLSHLPCLHAPGVVAELHKKSTL
jgi:hypothetical protein